jgi:hypothetical protein
MHIHWTSAVATTPNVVQWGMELSVANALETFNKVPPTNTYYATGATTIAYQHAITPIITLTGLNESAVVVGTIFRNVATAPVLDTYAGADVFGLSLDAHYVVQKAGSLNEFGDP